MIPSIRLFGPLKIWHFLVAGLLCYAVPIALYLKDLIDSGNAGAAGLAILASGLLVRHGCRIAQRPLEYGNRFACLILAAVAVSFILLSGKRLNPSLAYISFIIASIACAGWLGSWTLIRSLVNVWTLSFLFLPGISNWLQSASLEVWSFLILPASRALDFCLVPNDISGTTISLVGGKKLEIVSAEVQGMGLTVLVISTVVSFFHNRSFFFTFFASIVSLLTLPLFALCAIIYQCVMVYYFKSESSLWFPPLIAAAMVFLLNLGLHFFGSDHSEWIWQKEKPTLEEAGSVFEGCDFGPVMLLVLLLFAFSGLAASVVLVADRYKIAIF